MWHGYVKRMTDNRYPKQVDATRKVKDRKTKISMAERKSEYSGKERNRELKDNCNWEAEDASGKNKPIHKYIYKYSSPPPPHTQLSASSAGICVHVFRMTEKLVKLTQSHVSKYRNWQVYTPVAATYVCTAEHPNLQSSTPLFNTTEPPPNSKGNSARIRWIHHAERCGQVTWCSRSSVHYNC
jgi:hypothetical protein